jgi:hypothetical protein
MEKIKQDIATIFREAYSGMEPGADGTWFVQSGESILESLDTIDAAHASVIVAPGVSSIAAHAIHTDYYLSLTLDRLKGNDPPGDWPGSWTEQAVTDDEWDAVRAKMRANTDAFFAALATADFETYPGIQPDMIANIAHAAYHLGAIRQIWMVVKSRTTD